MGDLGGPGVGKGGNIWLETTNNGLPHGVLNQWACLAYEDKSWGWETLVLSVPQYHI